MSTAHPEYDEKLEKQLRDMARALQFVREVLQPLIHEHLQAVLDPDGIPPGDNGGYAHALWCELERTFGPDGQDYFAPSGVDEQAFALLSVEAILYGRARRDSTAAPDLAAHRRLAAQLRPDLAASPSTVVAFRPH